MSTNKRKTKNLLKRGVHAQAPESEVSSEDFDDDEYDPEEYLRPPSKRPKHQPWTKEQKVLLRNPPARIGARELAEKVLRLEDPYSDQSVQIPAEDIQRMCDRLRQKKLRHHNEKKKCAKHQDGQDIDQLKLGKRIKGPSAKKAPTNPFDAANPERLVLERGSAEYDLVKDFVVKSNVEDNWAFVLPQLNGKVSEVEKALGSEGGAKVLSSLDCPDPQIKLVVVLEAMQRALKSKGLSDMPVDYAALINELAPNDGGNWKVPFSCAQVD